MTKIELYCDGASARQHTEGPITEGAVGIEVGLFFNADWDGIGKFVVFKTALESRKAVEIQNKTIVPWEILKAGQRLSIGVIGKSADGRVVIPTIWADCGIIKPSPMGVEADDAEPAPTPSMVEQILAQVEQLRAEVGNNGSTGGTGGVTVTNRVEVGNMNAVTSNAVAVICGNIEALMGDI